MITRVDIFNFTCYQALVYNNLFAQKSSCIGRLPIEKHVSLLILFKHKMLYIS